MIHPDELNVLDHLIWFGKGRRVAERLFVDPSTVSRKAETCCGKLKLSLDRKQGEWTLFGDTHLLEMERALKQEYRLHGYAPLRVEACYESAWLLHGLDPERVSTGYADHLSIPRVLRLLESRVIDVWLTTFQPDLNLFLGGELAVRELLPLPLQVLAHETHPLAGQSRITPADLMTFPSLALAASDLFPNRHSHCCRHGLSTAVVRMRRHDPAKWEACLEDGQTLLVGTPLLRQQRPGLVGLNYDLGLTAPLCLVTRRELAEAPALQPLQQQIRQALATTTGLTVLREKSQPLPSA